MNFFLLLITKEDILKNIGNQTGFFFFSILWKSMNCLVTHILQNIFFCVQQKKAIHTDLEQLEGE